jgi:large subunit ribosomal protein L6
MIELKIKEGVTVEINGNEVETKGSLGSNKRKFNDALLKLTKKGDSITIDSIKDKVLAKKAAKAEVSFKKELENDMHGVTEHFERKMKTVFAHFPITVEVKGSDVLIKNLIGERYPRTSKIVGATKVEVKGQNLRIYGTSLDDVTQTSANIRQVCKMKNKDTRVFQDGLYYDTD